MNISNLLHVLSVTLARYMYNVMHTVRACTFDVFAILYLSLIQR